MDLYIKVNLTWKTYLEFFYDECMLKNYIWSQL